MNSIKNICFLFFAAILVQGRIPLKAAEANQLTEQEKRDGWVLLFDGKGLDGWRSFKKETAPTKGWDVQENCLHHISKGGGGDLVSKKEYKDFELQWEWKVAEGANSGLKYFITETRDSAIGHEYQLIDDKRHADALRGPKYQTASFYDVLIATDRQVKPAGEFNSSKIVVKGNHVEHWLNGGKVLEYELGSPAVLEAVAKSKFKKVEGFGTKVTGHLLIQDHADEIWFRNLKLRELK